MGGHGSLKRYWFTWIFLVAISLGATCGLAAAIINHQNYIVNDSNVESLEPTQPEETADGGNTESATPAPKSTTEPTPEPTPKSTSEPTTTPAPTSAQEPQAAECLIKGNVSNKGEKIYHVPGQKYYDKTVITPSKGERYFCTEAEAQAAGWRKSKV